MQMATSRLVFPPPLTPPAKSFQWYLQSNEILLNLSMKCQNSGFNAQGSRGSILRVQIGASENVCQQHWRHSRTKERQGET
jgi:hypothetical protein